MEQSNSDVKLGRFLSLVLRHDPSAAGIALDEHGWGDVDELLAGVGRTGRRIDRAALERIVRPGMRMLDLGCGSGILSIAALLLGAETAFACDIDEKAVGIAYQNAALNGVGRERYTVRAGDILSDIGLQREMGSGYDVIAANIVADVIIALAPAARPLLAPGGYFLCSGIIEGREAEVREALEAADFTVEEAGQSEGWHSFLCR